MSNTAGAPTGAREYAYAVLMNGCVVEVVESHAEACEWVAEYQAVDHMRDEELPAHEQVNEYTIQVWDITDEDELPA